MKQIFRNSQARFSTSQLLLLIALFLVIIINGVAIVTLSIDKRRVVQSIDLAPSEYQLPKEGYVSFDTSIRIDIGSVNDRYGCVNCANISLAAGSFIAELKAKKCDFDSSMLIKPWLLLENNGSSYAEYMTTFTQEIASEIDQDKGKSRLFVVGVGLKQAALEEFKTQLQEKAENANAQYFLIQGEFRLYKERCVTWRDGDEESRKNVGDIQIDIPAFERLHWPSGLENFQTGVRINQVASGRLFLTPINAVEK